MCAITAFHQQEVMCSCCDALSPVSLRLQPKWSIIETGLYKKRYSAYNLLERWTVSLNTYSVFGTMIRQHENIVPSRAHIFFLMVHIYTTSFLGSTGLRLSDNDVPSFSDSAARVPQTRMTGVVRLEPIRSYVLCAPLLLNEGNIWHFGIIYLHKT